MVRLICCQPATMYYAWQVETMLNSFINQGINLNHVDIVCSINPDSNPLIWEKLANNYPARFFFYPDDRPQPLYYISSVRPWILAKHFANHPYLENETIFYHDCDIALTRPIDFDYFEKKEECCGSDVRWYIAHSYIKSKGEDVLNKMCEIVGIPAKMVEENELNCIGAQYLLKRINQEFWLNVYRDSENLYREISILNKQKKVLDPSYHEIQIWCADMWALLWNLWKRGQKTETSPAFSFSWGTSTESDWHDHAIFHNAGVTGPDQGLFYKGLYINRPPFSDDLKINPGTASAKYYELMKSFKSVLCE